MRHHRGPAQHTARRNYLGRTVAGLGDIDGDGVSDYAAAGWIHLEDPAAPYGRVYIFSGETHKIIKTMTSFASGDGFGYAIAGVGDITDDGIAELAISAPAASNGTGQPKGVVYVFDLMTSGSHCTAADSIAAIENHDADNVFFGSVLAHDDLGSDHFKQFMYIGSVDGPLMGDGSAGVFSFVQYDLGTAAPNQAPVVAPVTIGDTVVDGKVDLNDIEAILIALDQHSSIGASIDLNADGVVDLMDAAIAIGNMGQMSPVLDLVADPSAILSRLDDLTTPSGGLNIMPGVYTEWPGADPCDDDDDDDGDNGGDGPGGNGGGDGIPGGTTQVDYPGVNPGWKRPDPTHDWNREQTGPPAAEIEPQDGCVDDDDDDDDDASGNSCPGCDLGDDPDATCAGRYTLHEFPRYVGMGMPYEIVFNRNDPDWSIFVVTGPDPDDVDGAVFDVNLLANTATYAIFPKQNFTGVINVKIRTQNINTGASYTFCLKTNLVEYKEVPFVYETNIPPEVIYVDLPDFGLDPDIGLDHFGGDSRFFCLFGIGLNRSTAIGQGWDITFRSRFVRDISPAGNVWPTGELPDCYPIDDVDEYVTGPLTTEELFGFGETYGYNASRIINMFPPPNAGQILFNTCTNFWGMPIPPGSLQEWVLAPGIVEVDVRRQQHTAYRMGACLLLDLFDPGSTLKLEKIPFGDERRGQLNSMLLYRPQPNTARLEYRLEGGNPLNPVAPLISVHAFVTLIWEIDQDTGSQAVTWSIHTMHQDMFPAHELSIGLDVDEMGWPIHNLGNYVEWFDPIVAGTSPLDLFDHRGNIIDRRRSGQIDVE